MQRLKFWIGGALAALVSTGIAIAANPGATTETPSATFSASAKRVQTRTCEGADGTYRITRGVYAGQMESSDPRLDGRLRISLHSVYNLDETSGWMRGTVHVHNAEAKKRMSARLLAVNLEGSVEGMLTGKAGSPRAQLFANIAASFGADGFADGKLGTGASTNQSLFFHPGCRKSKSGEESDARSAEAREKQKPQRGEKPSRPGAKP